MMSKQRRVISYVYLLLVLLTFAGGAYARHQHTIGGPEWWNGWVGIWMGLFFVMLSVGGFFGLLFPAPGYKITRFRYAMTMMLSSVILLVGLWVFVGGFFGLLILKP